MPDAHGNFKGTGNLPRIPWHEPQGPCVRPLRGFHAGQTGVLEPEASSHLFGEVWFEDRGRPYRWPVAWGNLEFVIRRATC